MRLIPPGATRQQRAPRNLAGENRSAADGAVAAALDRVLDSVDSLRQETFQSEIVQAPPSNVVEVARRSHPRRPLTLSLLVARLHYSRRTPYRQIRGGACWSLYVIGVFAISWAVITYVL